MSEIVPFGKYKGQPVEAMAADQGYLDWLRGQSWFRERYQNIYTVIVNNFTEPSETPEHNAFQVLFLDNEYAWKCACLARGDEVQRRVAELWRELEDFSARDGTVFYGFNTGANYVAGDAVARTSVKCQFEYMGADVHIEAGVSLVGPDGQEIYWKSPGGYGSRDFATRFQFWVEIKPSIGDDYPAVLRQMRKTRCPGVPILFVGEYVGVGATRDQFVETFSRAGIPVVFRGDWV